MRPLILSDKDIQLATDRTSLQKHMGECLRLFSTKTAVNFPRQVADLSEGMVLGFMPACALKSGLVGYKAVAVTHDNNLRGLNPHQGAVVLLESSTGRIKAMLEGSAVTALRTAAVSAAATDLLSRADCKVLAIIGSGRQAYEHALALKGVRRFERIVIYSRSYSSVEKLITTLRSTLDIEITTAKTPQHAVARADVVVTCTASRSPLLSIGDFADGTHINAIGACRLGQHEVSLVQHKSLKIFMDSEVACLMEASELRDALAKKAISQASLIGEIGQSLAGQIPGRVSADDITFFKSVGLGIEDVFAADYFYERALALGLGNSVEFTGGAL